MMVTKRSSILIVAVWSLVMLAVFNIGLYRIISSKLNFLRYIEKTTVAQRLVRGVISTITYQRKEDMTSYDTFNEFKQEMSYGQGPIKAKYSLIDLSSRININLASEDILARLANGDSDLKETISPSKLKTPKNFALKEDLFLRGIDQDSYRNIADHITVFGKNKFNINTVSAQVLEFLNFESSLISRLVEYRNGYDGLWGTEDDLFFASKQEIVDFDRRLGKKSLLDVESTVFQVDIKIMHSDKELMCYDIVLDNKGNILSWRSI